MTQAPLRAGSDFADPFIQKVRIKFIKNVLKHIKNCKCSPSVILAMYDCDLKHWRRNGSAQPGAPPTFGLNLSMQRS